MTTINNLLKPLRRLWMVWLGLYIITMLIVTGISMLFAPIGLNEAEKQAPHAFDNSFLNYKIFDSMIIVTPVLLISTIIIIVLLVATYPQTKSQSGKLEDKHE